ncbi:MAG TPA: quinoprotein relay system zinc metallohydrolase 2 [Methylophilaceae bacterium]|jgi:quinoprotein relay system zinc metallohydrolase 2|nr:quinoprotein relay system zinc metallohydrolase 2 [Methylophilaceae bacterium]
MQKWLILLVMLAPLPLRAEALPMEEAAPGVYVHHGTHEDLDQGYRGDICNIGFIVGEKGVAVIDSGGSLAIGQRLRESVRKVTSLPILYVINTHVHPDHIFGNAAFLADKPVYVGHANLANAMELRKEAYLRNNATWLGEAATGTDIVKPTQAVTSTLELDLGSRILLLTAYPTAHTNTDLTVLDNSTATLWTGDLLFVERTPSIDGDIKGWLSTIETLRTVSALRAIPGHGPVVADWNQALNNEQRYLETLLADVRNSIQKGESMEQAMDTAAAAEKENWVLFDNVNRRNVNLIYPKLEWE